VRIDPQTRDVVHNIHIRKVEKRGGQRWNQEVQTMADVKKSGKNH
jgi:branched-chain amino acid transport system substrate-binding protein